MQQPNTGTMPQGVPAKALHRTKLIEAKSIKYVEKETNKFLDTISEERRLTGMALMVNAKTGDYVQIINYQDLRPFTPTEMTERKEVIQKFIDAANPPAKDVSNFGQ